MIRSALSWVLLSAAFVVPLSAQSPAAQNPAAHSRAAQSPAAPKASPTTPATPASTAHRAALAKDQAELSTYALTMDTVSRLFQATHAAAEAAKTDPSLKISFEGDQDASSPTIDDLASKISSSPKLVALLAEQDFTPPQFAIASISLIQTVLALVAMQSGQTPAQIAQATHVNPANITLLQEHAAEIQALQAKYPTS